MRENLKKKTVNLEFFLNVEAKKMQANASAQTESVNSRNEMERRIGRIKDEFQSTIDTIESALKLANRNYEMKCIDIEVLKGQLNAERLENNSLKQQIKQFDITLNNRNKFIAQLQQEIVNLNENKNENMNMNTSNGSESEEQLRKELETVKKMLTEMLAYEKYVLDIEEQEKKIATLSDILSDGKKSKDAKKSSVDISNDREKEDRLKIEIEVLKHRLNAHIPKPIRTTINETEFKKMSRVENKPRFSSSIVSDIGKNTMRLNLMYSESESSASILRKNTRRHEANTDCSMDNGEVSSNNGEETQQDLLKQQIHKIKSLKYHINQEKERAAQIFYHKKSKFEKKLDKEKAYRDKVKTKLECIIRKNREVITKLSDAQKM